MKTRQENTGTVHFLFVKKFYSLWAWFYRCMIMIIIAAVVIYLVTGVARFLGVIFMRAPGIKPEMFLDWWWIKLVHLLTGK